MTLVMILILSKNANVMNRVKYANLQSKVVQNSKNFALHVPILQQNLFLDLIGEKWVAVGNLQVKMDATKISGLPIQ